MKGILSCLGGAALFCACNNSWGLSITFSGAGNLDSCSGSIGFEFSAADLSGSGQGYNLTLSDGTSLFAWVDIGRVAGPGLLNIGLMFPVGNPLFSIQEASAGRFIAGSPMSDSCESLFYSQPLQLGTDVYRGGFDVDVTWDGVNGTASGDWYLDLSPESSNGDATPVPDGGTTLGLLALGCLGLAAFSAYFVNQFNPKTAVSSLK